MRFLRLAAATLVVAVLARTVRADEAYDAAQARAREIAEAFAATDAARVKSLASEDEPDAWLVVDALLAAKRADAAKALAAARVASDADALRAVAGRALSEPPDARSRLADAEKRIADARWDEAIEALRGGGSIPDGPLRVRWFLARAKAFGGAERRPDQAEALRAAATSAQKVGWTLGALSAWREHLVVCRDDYDLLGMLASTDAIVEIARAAGLASLESKTEADAAEIETRLGDLRGAKAHLERALAVLPKDEAGSAALRETYRSRHGGLLAAFGDVARGVAEIQSAVDFLRAEGGKPFADASTELGQALRGLGDAEAAARCYQDALTAYGGDRDGPLPDDPEGREGVLATRANLVLIDVLGDRLDQALTAARALRERFLALSFPAEAARELQVIAEIRLQQAVGTGPERTAALAEARAAAVGAAAEARDGKDAIGALYAKLSLAAVEEKAGRIDVATRLCEETATEARAPRMPDVLVPCLTRLARLRVAKGAYRPALEAVEEGFRLIEDAYDDLGDRSRLGVRSRHAELFDVGMDAALRQGDQESFLRCLEAGRAVLLLDSLGNRDALRARGATPELEKERAAAAHAAYLASAELDRARRLDRGVREALAKFGEALARHERAIDAIQAKSRMASHLLYPQPVDLAGAREPLGKDSALVLFARVGEDAYAFVLTRDAAKYVPIGNATEASAACARAYVSSKKDDPAKAFGDAAKLWSRVSTEIPPATRVVYVSPDGDLGLLPYPAFDASPTSRAFVFTPSASTLALLANKDNGYAARKGEKTLAIAISAYSKVPSAAEGVFRGRRMIDLPSAEAEAKAVGGSAGDVTLLGPAATEEGFDEALAKRARWSAIHFGVHGLLDLRWPTLSSLVLFPSAASDGYLTAFELLQRDVSADVAVLSACDSGAGVAVPGEGLVGLVRAFFFAGCPRVVANLWSADDDSARAFSEAFHAQWKAKKDLADCLEYARAEVRKDDRWKHPYYWAGWCAWGLAQ